MARLPVRTWIINAAAVFFGRWGKVSEQAREADCSRQTAYEHARKVEKAVVQAQQGGKSREGLLQENQKLKEENEQLWVWLDQMIEFPLAKQQEFAAKAQAEGVSLEVTRELLAVVLPPKHCPSRARLGRWVRAVAVKAGAVLKIVDKLCQQTILSLCLDEIFFHRQPILVGVEPHSMVWALGERSEDRKGTTWQRVVEPFERLEQAVADGGSGLRAGMEAIQQKRQEQHQTPLEISLDTFHTHQEAHKVLSQRWKQVEGLWVRAEEADRKLEQARAPGKNLRSLSAKAQAAWKKAFDAFRALEKEEAAWQQAAQALELFCPEGTLNDRAWAEAQIAQAVAQLPGVAWAKVRRFLQDKRSLIFLDRLHRELAATVPQQPLREALVQLWWLRHQRLCRSQGSSAPLELDLKLGLQGLLCEKLDPAWKEIYLRVARSIRRTVRASSVVECMNSVLRMHQGRHRTVTQPMLDLKRLFWNCRPFRTGKRRARCPYELLGLKLPSHNAWELLQMDPKELAEKVSSQKLAA